MDNVTEINLCLHPYDDCVLFLRSPTGFDKNRSRHEVVDPMKYADISTT